MTLKKPAAGKTKAKSKQTNLNKSIIGKQEKMLKTENKS